MVQDGGKKKKGKKENNKQGQQLKREEPVKQSYFSEGLEEPDQGRAKTRERSSGAGQTETQSGLSADIFIKTLNVFDTEFYFIMRKYKSDCHEWKIKYLQKGQETGELSFQGFNRLEFERNGQHLRWGQRTILFAGQMLTMFLG